MDPRCLWDVDNVMDLVENNFNKFDNSNDYYESHINDSDEFMDNDFYI